MAGKHRWKPNWWGLGTDSKIIGFVHCGGTPNLQIQKIVMSWFHWPLPRKKAPFFSGSRRWLMLVITGQFLSYSVEIFPARNIWVADNMIQIFIYRFIVGLPVCPIKSPLIFPKISISPTKIPHFPARSRQVQSCAEIACWEASLALVKVGHVSGFRFAQIIGFPDISILIMFHNDHNGPKNTWVIFFL